MQQLAGYNRIAAAALRNPPSSWLWWVEEYSYQGPQEPLFDQPCCNCGNRDCEAFIALYCGGCERTYWQQQRITNELWCTSCVENNIRRNDDALALEQYTGQSYEQARLLFEAREQVVLAWCQWRIRCWAKQCQIITRSRILATRCCNQIPWYPPVHSRKRNSVPKIIGPLGRTSDPDQVLDNIIKRVQGLTITNTSSKRNKKKKGKKK